MLKQSVLAHIYGCHKSVLLLKAACSHCSGHASSYSAVLQNCIACKSSWLFLSTYISQQIYLQWWQRHFYSKIELTLWFFSNILRKSNTSASQTEFFSLLWSINELVFYQNPLSGQIQPLLHSNKMFSIDSWLGSQLLNAHLVTLIISKFGPQRFILQDKAPPWAKVCYLRKTLKVP